MSEKILQIKVPPIIGYTVHAYPLSVICNEDKCLPWLFCNYIQLVCNTRYEGVFLDFDTLCNILDGNEWIESIYPGIPWLQNTSIHYNIIVNCNINIHSLIKEAIDQGNYIVAYLDEFHIPQRMFYKKDSFFHENLIYGYDTDEMTYNILGFNDQRIFSTSKVSFQELEQGFTSTHLNYRSENYVRLLKIDRNYSYDLDLEFISDSLDDYINSTNTSRPMKTLRNPKKDCVYGVSVYDQLINYLDLLSDEKTHFDIRPIHILLEHKKCMVLRLDFISKMYPSAVLDEICQEYLDIEKKCLNMRQDFIKYYIVKQPSIIKNMVPTLKSVCEKEKEILPKLITELRALKQ